MSTAEIRVGQSVRLRKKHACGNDIFHVMRTGADIKLKCISCGHIILLDRLAFNKRFKSVAEEI